MPWAVILECQKDSRNRRIAHAKPALIALLVFLSGERLRANTAALAAVLALSVPPSWDGSIPQNIPLPKEFLSGQTRMPAPAWRQ